MHVEGMGDASPPGSPLSSWTGSQCCSLDYWTLQPPPHPPTSQVPLLEHGCQYQAGCWPGGCWGTEAAGTRGSGDVAFPDTMLSPISLGSLGEGPPCSLQGHRHCYLEPTRPGYPSTFATFLPSPFSVATRFPMFFSGHHSPALLVSISVSQSLFPFCHILSHSLRSFSLSFCVCLSCFRAL